MSIKRYSPTCKLQRKEENEMNLIDFTVSHSMISMRKVLNRREQ